MSAKTVQFKNFYIKLQPCLEVQYQFVEQWSSKSKGLSKKLAHIDKPAVLKPNNVIEELLDTSS